MYKLIKCTIISMMMMMIFFGVSGGMHVLKEFRCVSENFNIIHCSFLTSLMDYTSYKFEYIEPMIFHQIENKNLIMDCSGDDVVQQTGNLFQITISKNNSKCHYNPKVMIAYFLVTFEIDTEKYQKYFVLEIEKMLKFYPVAQLEAITVSRSTALLEWVQPDLPKFYNGRIVYHITYKTPDRYGKMEYGRLTQNLKTNNRLLLKKLQPDTSYAITIACKSTGAPNIPGMWSYTDLHFHTTSGNKNETNSIDQI